MTDFIESLKAENAARSAANVASGKETYMSDSLKAKLAEELKGDVTGSKVMSFVLTHFFTGSKNEKALAEAILFGLSIFNPKAMEDGLAKLTERLN